MGREILPASGACVVFTIDPVASLDPEVQDDFEAIAACEKLVSKKYVGIADRQTLYHPGQPYNPCFVRFLLQGEPLTSEERYIEPTMSVPIVPITKPHLSARDPIKASNPLPWNDCYVTSYTYAEVKSLTKFTEEPIDYQFSLDELNRLDRFLGRDVERTQDLLWEKAEQIARSRLPAPTRSDIRKVVASLDEGSARYDKLSRRVVTVDLTHDLSTIEELTDPEDYFREVEAIIRLAFCFNLICCLILRLRIEEDARPRVARANALAVEAARKEAERIDAQIYDDHTVNLLVEHLTFKSRVSRMASKVKTKGRNIGRRIFRVTHLLSHPLVSPPPASQVNPAMDMSDNRSVDEESMNRYDETRQILPTVGACVVFSLDPVDSLDPDVQKDVDAVAACKKLVTKKYVGLVSDRQMLFAPYARFNPCVVLFILQGEPQAIPDEFFDPSMTLPILPTTAATHVSGRDPMKPSRPLPWNDCYLSCYHYASVRSRTTFTRDPIDYTFDIEDMVRSDLLLGRDGLKRRNVLRAREAAQAAQSPLAPADSNLQETGVQTETPTGLANDSDWIAEATTGDQLASDDAAAPRGSFEDPEPPLPQGATTVIFSHDLSTAEELADPADFFKEVEAVARIQNEAWPRVVAAKARATKEAMKEAERINAKAYDDHTVDLLIERTTFRSRVSRVTSKIRSKGRAIGGRILRLTRLCRNK
ncbi:hypothetical protein C8R46DRAFT_1202499 [Mycena filopes]|nr:hypothetical protein C8R46DRAFT_1202499 [Mycena filopes]